MSQVSFLRKIYQSIESCLLNSSIRWIARTLVIAIVYSIAARLSIEFATLPNKVSAVWLPSGLTTAWVAWFGIRKAAPGIFAGVIAGLVMDAGTITPPLSTLGLTFLGLMIGLGDTLQPIVIVAMSQRITNLPNLFNKVRTVAAFILATLAGPALSATLGVTALAITQPATREQYGISWITWCLASTLANLLFTPLLLLWKQRSQFQKQALWMERGVLIGLVLGLNWITFSLNYPVEYMFLPLLIWSAFRLGSFFTSFLIALIAIIAIPMTARGFGPFMTRSPNESLLLLQSFIAVCSVTNIILAAAIHERRTAELALERTLESLEQQVQLRTAELQESKSIVDSFFASAPVGLGIVDDNLQYVQVNDLLANFNGRSIASHLGQTIQKISPDRASSLAPMYRQVLLTGQPILNQEETRITLDHPSEARTWLMSYFPIATHDFISKVGLVVMEISDRKQLEQQLKNQARQDPLTGLSNRLHFKEASESEWKRCQRSVQPFSLILIDVDYFKRYNDTYGHLAGDACLIQVAQVLMTIGGRAGDLVVRFGGEEFLIMLSGTDAIGAQKVAESVRQRLKDCQIPHSSSSVGDYVTLSMGVVSCIPNAKLQVDYVTQKADEALYESKDLGRDRMTIVTLSPN
jgi:diguanylate cyclase (GGDEF)-like protein/PAS domain S-box-containing protein